MPSNPFTKLRGVKYTAIDFGHYSLKAAHCRGKAGKIKVLDCGQRKLPPGAIVNGQIDDFLQVSRHLQQLLDELDGEPGQVIFTPAVGQELVRKLEITDMPEEELEEALRWEVEEFLNLPPERVASDFFVLEEKEESLEVLMAVLPLDVLEGYERVFEEIKIKPRVANVQELSLISLLSFQNELEESACIVNFGAEKTRITIANQEEFFLSRTVEVGGSNFTRIFKDEESTWEEAETTKFRSEYPLNSEVEEEEALDVELMVAGMDDTSRIKRRMQEEAGELINEVSRSLEYYRDRHSGEGVSSIFVTGGGFRLKNLKEYLEEEIGETITRIDPFQDLASSTALAGGEEHIMSVALGLVASEVIYHAN